MVQYFVEGVDHCSSGTISTDFAFVLAGICATLNWCDDLFEGQKKQFRKTFYSEYASPSTMDCN